MKQCFFTRPNILHTLSSLLCLLAFLLLLARSSSIPGYARDGLYLWAYSALPVLLPFIILSKFWIFYGIPEQMIHWFRRFFKKYHSFSVTFPVLLLGLCSGFPIGAIFVRHFYENRTFSGKTAERLLPLCSFVSPMFLLGYVHSLFQGSKKEWYIMLICLYAPLLLLYMIRLLLHTLPVSEHTDGFSRHTQKSLTIQEIWSSSLEIIFTIGIYMMLFSILFGLSEESAVCHALPFHILLTNLEITTGCQYIIHAGITEGFLNHLLLLSALEFGGLCTFAQIRSVLEGTGLSMKCYLKTKMTSVMVSGVIYQILQWIS